MLNQKRFYKTLIYSGAFLLISLLGAPNASGLAKEQPDRGQADLPL
jgi:hypothetical protein